MFHVNFHHVNIRKNTFLMLAVLCLLCCVLLTESYAIPDKVIYIKTKDNSLIETAIYNANGLQYDKMIPIVFIHCLGCAKGRWNTVLNEIYSTENTNIFETNPMITISLRGHGNSQYFNKSTVNNYQTNINDIITVLSEIGIHTPCIFVGHSFGSMIVNKMIITNPQMVYAAIVMGTLTYFDDDLHNILHSFKQYTLQEWYESKKELARVNIEPVLTSNRINEDVYFELISDQMIFDFDIQTKTEFIPYDIRINVENGDFDNIPFVIIQGSKDFMKKPLIEPFIVRSKEYKTKIKVDYLECDDCDHQIMFGNEKRIVSHLKNVIHIQKNAE
eukprot:271940_1